MFSRAKPEPPVLPAMLAARSVPTCEFYSVSGRNPSGSVGRTPLTIPRPKFAHVAYATWTKSDAAGW
jgi:hypothetical protein